jgi:hypothetical protein
MPHHPIVTGRDPKNLMVERIENFANVAIRCILPARRFRGENGRGEKAINLDGSLRKLRRLLALTVAKS